MKLKINFAFGIEFRGNGDAILGHEQVSGIVSICEKAIELFGGYTKFPTFFAWRDQGVKMTLAPDTKMTLAEAGVTISVIASGDNNQVGLKIDQMVQQIKFSLQQAAVGVTRTEVEFDIL